MLLVALATPVETPLPLRPRLLATSVVLGPPAFRGSEASAGSGACHSDVGGPTGVSPQRASTTRRTPASPRNRGHCLHASVETEMPHVATYEGKARRVEVEGGRRR